jgi:hypothetical protein
MGVGILLGARADSHTSVSAFEARLGADTDNNPDFKLFDDLNYDTIAQECLAFRHSTNEFISNGPLSNEAISRTISSADPQVLASSTIPSIWTNISKVDNDNETRHAGSRVVTALSLKAHSDLWMWFSEQVTNPVSHLLETPIVSRHDPNVQPHLPNEWISPLFQKVEIQLLLKNDINLVAADYFKDLDAPNYTAPYNQTSKTLFHVESAVLAWLRFHPRPGMMLTTSRAIATFVSVASAAFGNSDFLYLSYVQDRVKTLAASLTAQKIPLTKIPWGRLADELNNHPLANPNSDESNAVRMFKELTLLVSGFSKLDYISPDIAEHYSAAVEMGGDAGVAMVADFTLLPCPM